MKIRDLKALGCAAALSLFTVACGQTEGAGPQNAGEYDFDGVSVGAEGSKADMASKMHLIDDIDLNSIVSGTFQPRKRVYGFTFEARAGATVHMDIRTAAGRDSIDADAGKPLDTVASVYGPMEGEDKGQRLAYNDDNDDGMAAKLPALQVAQDGKYVVMFSSWDDPGTGKYEVELSCEGTNYQCRQPVYDRPCQEGTRYVQGGTTIGTETWSHCNVVLLETVEVEDGAILTINPGVHVKGNFIAGEGNSALDQEYGVVGLDVNGTLQAVGSERHPVVFTSLRDGWRGLNLKGNANTLRHVTVEKAGVGVTVSGVENAIEHTVVDTVGTGFVFTEDSENTALRHVKISQADNGIRMTSAEISLEDTIISGTGKGDGISATGGGPTEVRRSIISGFNRGLFLDDTEFLAWDSTIVGNVTGVVATGPDAGVNPAVTCPAMPRATTPAPRPRPATPRRWGLDPVFVRCDIMNNATHGVHVLSPQLLVVEDSNVTGNGESGITIASDSLHPESRINTSNVFGNGEIVDDTPESYAQVRSWHINGNLDISSNYWDFISDPELSLSWDVEHTYTETCRQERANVNGCTRRTNTRYTCGAWNCNYNNSNRRWNCTAQSQETNWEGDVTFTGFSPELMEVGPVLTDLSPAVTEARLSNDLTGVEVEEEEEEDEGKLVINEVDYDQPGRDDAEFIELYNAGGAPISLADLRLEMVNGWNGTVYGQVDLSQAGTLQAGEYLVIGDPAVTENLSNGVQGIRLPTAIQNGTPDGLRIVDADNKVIDGLAYEGWMGGVSEGDAPAAWESNSGVNDSIARCGNGVDTDNNADDFKATIPTPGADNDC